MIASGSYRYMDIYKYLSMMQQDPIANASRLPLRLPMLAPFNRVCICMGDRFLVWQQLLGYDK